MYSKCLTKQMKLKQHLMGYYKNISYKETLNLVLKL